jgi:hypothetical protein
MSIEQVEELGLERRSRSIGVEIGEKGIVGLFVHDGRFESRAEPFGQRRLADADRSLERDMAKLQGCR